MLIVLFIISVLVNIMAIFIMLQMSLNHRGFKDTVETDVAVLFAKARALENGKVDLPGTSAPQLVIPSNP